MCPAAGLCKLDRVQHEPLHGPPASCCCCLRLLPTCGCLDVFNVCRLMQNVVEAAREIGLPACFTAAVLNRTGGLVDQEMRCGRSPGWRR